LGSVLGFYFNLDAKVWFFIQKNFIADNCFSILKNPNFIK
jgi:hypothetical protein